MNRDEENALELESFMVAFTECQTAIETYGREHGIPALSQELENGTALRTSSQLFSHTIWKMRQVERMLPKLRTNPEPFDFLLAWVRATEISTILTAIGAMPYMRFGSREWNRLVHGITDAAH
ncbi:MAG: hypothetical protein Athens041674_104 [Parcubacteria group bacterium Athens0416_74]|nr:MAG: hypothetical protein Athens041674_104 [Parcubacteria group bacterium Athens0416_74]